MLLYTYISRFPVNPHYQQQLYLRPPLVMFFNFSRTWPTFAFAGESGYTPGFTQRIAHKRLHAETGASLLRAQRGFALPVKLRQTEQPEKVDARLMACVRFLRHRSPAVSLFGRALPKHTLYQYDRRH